LEPCKFEPPPADYLKNLQHRCQAAGIILVFDEMVSGLKMGLPGAQTHFGVQPDLSTWGKGFGNGFAIAALSGRADLLELGGLEPEGARKLFLLSSTHGGESVGFAALLATLDAFQGSDLISENWRKGEQLRNGLNQVILNQGLRDYLQIDGYPCLLLLTVKGPDGRADAAFRTYLLQELIARGLMTQGTFFMTPSHGAAELERTLDAFDRACAMFADALAAASVADRLIGPPIKPVFRALK
jgi:glutamate-1-semialdehyde 2,1-aminomutase